MASTTPFEIVTESADAVTALCWRAFGQAGDLDLDFSAPQRAVLVTRVLVCCGADAARAAPDEEAVWNLTLAARTGALCAIVAQTEGRDALTVPVRCTLPACQQPFEIELSLLALFALARDAEQRREIDLDCDNGSARRVRRPTGADQRHWQAARYTDAVQAERAVFASLLVEVSEVTARGNAQEISRIASFMTEHDPLVNFNAVSVCPACESRQELSLDLEALLLARLGRHQQALMRDVHRLASRYGWREREVLALPAWRRRAYLRQIEQESV